MFNSKHGERHIRKQCSLFTFTLCFHGENELKLKNALNGQSSIMNLENILALMFQTTELSDFKKARVNGAIDNHS